MDAPSAGAAGAAFPDRAAQLHGPGPVGAGPGGATTAAGPPRALGRRLAVVGAGQTQAQLPEQPQESGRTEYEQGAVDQDSLDGHVAALLR
ncbi:hypothetical protein [Kitasatospora sp. NPDC058218]|uniref:hypothetical protein n=1 Tax=Kitasatospora sp. NPDC058218 TaxID=3346385 RepID=UPI0036DC5D90